MRTWGIVLAASLLTSVGGAHAAPATIKASKMIGPLPSLDAVCKKLVGHLDKKRQRCTPQRRVKRAKPSSPYKQIRLFKRAGDESRATNLVLAVQLDAGWFYTEWIWRQYANGPATIKSRLGRFVTGDFIQGGPSEIRLDKRYREISHHPGGGRVSYDEIILCSVGASKRPSCAEISKKENKARATLTKDGRVLYKPRKGAPVYKSIVFP